MKNTLISLIVPVYNVEKYVEKCLRSLIAQTYEPIEIIIVSDGSQDGSDLICQRYAERYPQIRYFRTENHGVSAARNFGLSKARGECCMLVDSDDHLEADTVQRMMDVMEQNVRAVSGNEAVRMDDMVCRIKSVEQYGANPLFARLSLFYPNMLKQYSFVKEREFDYIR